MTMRVPRGTPIRDRIRAHVLVDGNGCWIWQCTRDRRGYGRITMPTAQGGGRKGVHRVSYEAFVGPISPGMTVDHTCFNIACANPEHLQLLTLSLNSRYRRDFDPDYCRHGHARTPENTLIRRRYGKTIHECLVCNVEREQRRSPRSRRRKASA